MMELLIISAAVGLVYFLVAVTIARAQSKSRDDLAKTIERGEHLQR